MRINFFKSLAILLQNIFLKPKGLVIWQTRWKSATLGNLTFFTNFTLETFLHTYSIYTKFLPLKKIFNCQKCIYDNVKGRIAWIYSTVFIYYMKCSSGFLFVFWSFNREVHEVGPIVAKERRNWKAIFSTISFQCQSCFV